MLTSEILKNCAKKFNASGCGIANIERFSDAPIGFSPTDVFSRCKSVVVFIKQMPTGSIFAENPVPYTYTTKIMFEEIDRISMELLRCCQANGADAVIIPPDAPYLYWDEENKVGKGIISLKHAAAKAGLGIIGRNSLLINPNYGNMVYIGAILVDVELEQDKLVEDFSCIPNCNKCINICPQHAIINGEVEQKLCRERSILTTERNFKIYNCNECRKVCPLMIGKI